MQVLLLAQAPSCSHMKASGRSCILIWRHGRLESESLARFQQPNSIAAEVLYESAPGVREPLVARQSDR
jgi:hypothetical protein